MMRRPVHPYIAAVVILAALIVACVVLYGLSQKTRPSRPTGIDGRPMDLALARRNAAKANEKILAEIRRSQPHAKHTASTPAGDAR